jgi:hypothetical protein
MTPYPGQEWMEQQARNATMEGEWGFLRGCRYLLHERQRCGVGSGWRSAEVLRARDGVGVEGGTASHVWQSHLYKDVCGLAQTKGLPSLICHEPAIEVKFMRAAEGTTSFLAMRAQFWVQHWVQLTKGRMAFPVRKRRQIGHLEF